MRRVGQPGIEPGTSVLSGLRSSRLSYWPTSATSVALTGTRARPRIFRQAAPEPEESGAEVCCGCVLSDGEGRGVWDLWCRSDRPGKAHWRSARSSKLSTEGRKLPRKEVIQPHLPVRLPCYDFVPIAGSALDTSLPCGLGQWLQAYPTFMT